MAGVKTQPSGCEEQQPGERHGPCARGHKPEQRDSDSSQARLAGVGEPTVLVAMRVVQAAPWLSGAAGDRPCADVPTAQDALRTPPMDLWPGSI
jgi:hypothetical protein